MMATQPKRRRSFRLSAEQRTQLRRARGKGSEYERVTPRADRSAFPLSSGQRRLWFLEQLEPGHTAYNMPAMVRLRGRLEVEVLRRALDEIFRRHEILRARFADERGEPRQIIEPAERLRIPIHDLSQLPAARRRSVADELALREARRTFDLAEGPLARISVLRLAAEEHLLLVVMHHLVTDGVSTGILIRELGPLYEAFAAGRPSPLAELEIQYADFTAWQSARLQGERLDKELAHWRACLAGAPEALELPFDRPRPPARSQRGMALRFPASAELGGRIRRFSQEQGTTQFIVLLACFEVLLHLSTGHRDLVVGTPVSGRSRREVAGLIGFFVNTLVLRLELGRDSSFRQLLERVKQVSAEAIAHQEVPFERLVETLQPERALSRSPLFQVMFGLEGSVGVDASRVSLGGLEARLIKLDRKAALVDLMLVIEGTESGFNTLWELDTDLFDAATVGRLNRRYLDLLDQLLRHPERPLSRLEALVRGERQQVLYEWNDTAVTSRPSLLHQFFERQARQRPEAIAVICGEQRLTYGLLEARANQLAHLLSQQGLAAESRVAVLLPRTLDCVVALLSVLKAGCAYVPLDPAYPQERLTYMLEDSGAEIVLMGQDLATPSVETSAAKPVRALQLEGTRWALSGERRGPCATAARPGHLAYVIYTSGSTGRPKGVAIEHRSAAALIAWSHNVFSASELSGVLAATSLCFDLSIFELFVTLGRGGTVILANGALDLPRLPARDEVTLINTVPSAMAELVRTGGVPASVRTVNLAGEALRGALVASIYRLPQVERLLNLYGPSEDTTYSTGAVMGRQATHPAIGSPIAGTAAYVLDRAGSPVPLGVSGELYLGGAGLSRGYLGRAGLTAERFVPDGVSGSEGGRLYRTGDRVRHRPSGELDFQGRFDHQVKLRGFRIELGEIESVLESHTGVGSSVVRVDALGSSGGRLVAYWEDGEGPAPSAAALRSYLGARLPEYMVPAVLQRLEPLPRTPNGKVDRSALPAVSVQGSGAAVAPRTPYEEVLSQLWEELLGVECVGVEDDFFALGGHSLLATRMISRVRDDFGCELPVRHLFEHPTVAGLAREIEARQERGAIAGGTSIEPAPRTGRIPLSLAQRRLWLLQHLDGGFAYNMPVALRLRGELDWAALHTAVRHIAERHESLRTVFPARGGEPFQRILVAPAAVISVRDLSALAAAGRQAEADRWLRAEVRQPFDLESAPPWRLTLLRLDREEHLLVINLHHIISDGWSLSLFAGEMASCYEAAIEGRRPSLPQLPIQLADYAIWQQGWLAGDAREELLDFWRQRIAGAPQHLELPTDRPRPERPSFRGREQAIVLQAGLAGRLRTFSRERRATHFMTLLAAFQAVLSRTTGQRDLLIGSPIAGRQQSETEALIGCFVNTLVLRAELDGEPSFGQLVARVREQALEAYRHQALPFDLLVEELAPQRDEGRNPLFQVMMAFQNGLDAEPRLGDLKVDPWLAERHVSLFDLTLSWIDGRRGLEGSLEYATDLFDATTVKRLAGHLTTLLEAAVETPETAVSELPLLGAAERHQLRHEWNDQSRAQAHFASVHRQIEVQAELTPDRIALICGDEMLTYRDLVERAGRLSRHLSSLGVGAGSLVGLCLDRSPELIVSLLGVLGSGGAYVPLDSNDPADRVAFVLEDAGVEVILTRSGSQAEPSRVELGSTGPRVVRVEEALELGADAGRGLSGDGSGAALDSLAYVIYTSGSTGRPKGVAISHRALAAYTSSAIARYGLDAKDRLLQFASISFDASVEEIYPCLTLGATLALRSDDLLDSVAKCLSSVAAWRISVLTQTTAYWHEMVRALSAGETRLPRTVRSVLFGGEAARSESVRLWFEHVVPEVDLVNTYGPTEATVVATSHRIAASEPLSVIVPIGRPLAGARAPVVSSTLRSVPIGVPGELCLAGDGLARGYVGQPALTASRFVPDPFMGCGARLYRTGDRVRHRDDGSLEYLGRLDRQVKVRGFRVELGEIESVLEQHPEVRAAAVAAPTVRSGRQLLAAYVVPSPEGAAVTARGTLETRLRHHLQANLPSYMVPASIQQLEHLPLLSSGKVDHKALPMPDVSLPKSSAGEGAGTRTPYEELLAGIWGEVLGLEQVGPEENFFELGGHSLLAMRVTSRVLEAFGVELPVRRLFDTPTVAGLAEVIASIPREEGLPSGGAMTRAERSGRLALSFAQQRLWLIDQLDPGSSAYNVVSPLRLEGALEPAVFRYLLTEIGRRHEVLRTTYREHDGEPFQVILPPRQVPLPVIDLRGLGETRRASVLEELLRGEEEQPFDLADGPVWRARLVRLAATEHVLILVVHHIAFDLWSTAVLIREAAALYRAWWEGRAPSLAEPSVQYADFAAWQRRWLRDEVMHDRLESWRRRTGGEIPTLALPYDRAHPSHPSYRGGSARFDLPPELYSKLVQMSRSEGATIFMVLLAALKALLFRYSSQESVVVGTDVAGRNRAEIESSIGFFVNILPLCTRLDRDPTFLGLVRRVRETALEAYAHQDVPFDRLVEELQPDRSARRSNPLFQVLFVLQNVAMPSLELSDLKLTAIEMAPRRSKFELMLVVQEVAGGLSGSWVYSRDLFDQETVERLSAEYGKLVSRCLQQPDIRLSQLQESRATKGRKVVMEKTRRKRFDLKRRPARRRQAVDLQEISLVELRSLEPDQPLPLVVERAVEDLDLLQWATEKQDFLERELRTRGGVLFRGFGIETAADFENFCRVLCPKLFGDYGDLPREELGEKIYSSTPYPPSQPILFHNESSQMPMWPRKQFFCCLQVAAEGGETPIVDCREVYRRMDATLRRQFEEKGLLYVRNFVAGLDVSWQEFFGTEDPREAEASCTRSGLDYEWRDESTLSTSRLAPAVLEHPLTGDHVFFNQILAHHVSCLGSEVQESLYSLFGRDSLPRNVYFGDGSPIADTVVEEILGLYREAEVVFPWQRGDVLMVDNMLTAHSRNPFAGQRKVVVAMGEMVDAEKAWQRPPALVAEPVQ